MNANDDLDVKATLLTLFELQAHNFCTNTPKIDHSDIEAVNPRH